MNNGHNFIRRSNKTVQLNRDSQNARDGDPRGTTLGRAAGETTTSTKRLSVVSMIVCVLEGASVRSLFIGRHARPGCYCAFTST
jgi:hypothetical protein